MSQASEIEPALSWDPPDAREQNRRRRRRVILAALAGAAMIYGYAECTYTGHWACDRCGLLRKTRESPIGVLWQRETPTPVSEADRAATGGCRPHAWRAQGCWKEGWLFGAIVCHFGPRVTSAASDEATAALLRELAAQTDEDVALWAELLLQTAGVSSAPFRELATRGFRPDDAAAFRPWWDAERAGFLALPRALRRRGRASPAESDSPVTWKVKRGRLRDEGKCAPSSRFGSHVIWSLRRTAVEHQPRRLQKP